jgi:pimeloyl-ACP methyl ester carboxylesterase
VKLTALLDRTAPAGLLAPLARKGRLGPLSVAAGAALLSAPLLWTTAHARLEERRDLDRHPLPGRRVDIGGRRLHASTAGAGRPGPTALFLTGLGCPLDVWARVQGEVARSMPTVAYDRAGLGGSDRAPGPRTGQAAVDDLDRLLEAIGEPGPYVLVGHSYGGLLARLFADRHPDRTAGMVLVDSSHPDQLLRSPGQRAGMPVMRMQMRQNATLTRLGFARLSESYLLTGIEDLPADAFARARARAMTARAALTACDEVDGWTAGLDDDVRPTVLPPGCPLTVLTAGQSVARDPVHGELQDELAGLSTDGVRQTVADADHFGLVMHPSYAPLVADAIRRTAARWRQAGGGSDVTPVEENRR